PSVHVSKSDSAELSCRSAVPRNPRISAVGGPENCPATSDYRGGVCTGEKERSQDVCCPTSLTDPFPPAICCSENLSVLSNRGPGNGVSKEGAVKDVRRAMLLIYPVVSSVCRL